MHLNAHLVAQSINDQYAAIHARLEKDALVLAFDLGGQWEMASFALRHDGTVDVINVASVIEADLVSVAEAF